MKFRMNENGSRRRGSFFKKSGRKGFTIPTLINFIFIRHFFLAKYIRHKHPPTNLYYDMNFTIWRFATKSIAVVNQNRHRA